MLAVRRQLSSEKVAAENASRLLEDAWLRRLSRRRMFLPASWTSKRARLERAMPHGRTSVGAPELSPSCAHDDDRLRLPPASPPSSNSAEKKELTGPRLSQLCPPCANRKTTSRINMVLNAAIRLSSRRRLNDPCKLSQRSLHDPAHRAHIDLGGLPGSSKIGKAGASRPTTAKSASLGALSSAGKLARRKASIGFENLGPRVFA